jgi:quercetin dioxygenase-like cupin family protein
VVTGFRRSPGDAEIAWGYVVRGKLTYKTGDREEVIEGGEAFYVPPGHTLISDTGTEVVFFSPTTEWQQTLGNIGKRTERAPA